jgi:ATP-dependent helicase YprA (DUF1998 family)
MPKMVQLVCAQCGIKFDKEKKEFKRRTGWGIKKFYCSISCGAIAHNEKNKVPILPRNCFRCGKKFTPRTRRAKRGNQVLYCSRSCASLSSITEKRIQCYKSLQGTNNLVHDTYTISLAMKSREKENYKHLVVPTENVIYEHAIENRIFDLYLPDYNTLIELDGIYHKYADQQKIDREKDAIAERNGFAIIRLDGDPRDYTLQDVLESIINQ